MNARDREFYSAMPDHAGNYAIPVEYAESGFVKHGRNSLVHEQAFEKFLGLQGTKAAKIVSVYLSDRSDVMALKDGLPVMTTQGFGGFDGIMSATGSGAIDTSIVFRLFDAGYSPESIGGILAEKSGFKAMRGKDAALAEKVFLYQLVKAVGAGMAVLEGADAVVISGEDCPEVRSRAKSLTRALSFSGLKVHCFYSTVR